jgi:hypothetical protein
MKRFALPLALLFILAGAGRIASAWRQLSITFDEPYHFSCGLDYLGLHRLCVGENPPLGPIASAVLPWLDGVRPDPEIAARGRERSYRERTEIGFAQLHEILLRSPNPWRTIALMRAGILPFFVLAALAIFFASRRWFGDAGAVCSTVLFTLTPTVLAHAGLATTDMALTATLTATFFLLAWWSEAPSWPRAVALGVAGGLMLFSKFSSLGYLPAAAALALAFDLTVAGRKPRGRISGLLVAIGIAVFVLAAGYLFDFGRLVNTFRELADHARVGHGGAYLLGQTSNHGWWYYYPVALAVKTPIALLVLAAAGLSACWTQRKHGGLLPVAFVLGILLTAMPSRINLGTRHILPVFAGLAMVGGLGMVRLARWSPVLPAALLSWMAFSGARAHPDYLAYFNEFAGSRPDNILLDSDLDWDQDWVLAARFLRARGATDVTIDLGQAPFTTNEVLEKVYGLPPIRPASEWHVIDVTRLRLSPAAAPWRRRQPIERIGGLLLFHIPRVSE